MRQGRLQALPQTGGAALNAGKEMIMKLIVEVDEMFWKQKEEECDDASAGNCIALMAMEERLKAMFGEGVKVEDASLKVILDRKKLQALGQRHAESEQRGVGLLRKAKDEKAVPEVILMYETGVAKAKGFKEGIEEIFWEADGEHKSIEELVKEHGDLSGLW